jgi:hypothetical protein
VKALSSAQNLRESVGAIEKIERMRPVIITSEDGEVAGDVS